MKFLIDKEINLSEQDLLHTKDYANTIKDAILNSPAKESFCIGLFGEWGSGKSSIISTVKSELEKDKIKKIKFITYDAWKYANDSFRRMFLLKMKEELNFKKKDLFDSFYQNKSTDKSIEQKPNWFFIGLTAIILIVGIALISNIEDVENQVLTGLIFSFAGILVNVFGKAFKDYKVTVSAPVKFAPEQFEECFEEMATTALKHDNTLKCVLKWIEKKIGNSPSVSNLDKLVIVFDNIDRTPKELAYELLTNTKNFLGKIPNIIFLIPVDDGSLKKHVLNSKADPKEAEEFLRKFFNLTFRIKPFRPIEMYSFTYRLVHSSGLDISNITIDVISKEYATNPRRIIQFINNLTVELAFLEGKFGKDFIKENESAICVLLILKEEWPEYFTYVASNPYLLQRSDEKGSKIILSNMPLNTFLQNIKAVIQDIDTESLFKIISNSNEVSNLSEELLRLIEAGDSEKILNHIKSNSIEDIEIDKYLHDKLDKGLNNQLYPTVVRNTFTLITRLNSKKEFQKVFNSRVSQIVENRLPLFLSYIEDTDSLVRYGIYLKSKGLPYLDKYITELLKGKSNNNKLSPFESDLLRSFIKLQEDDLAVTLKNQFELDYKVSEIELVEYDLSDEKYESLITDNIISFIISKTNSFFESENINELAFAAKKVNFSDNSYKLLFTKLNEIYPANVLRPLTQEKLLKLLGNLNSILDNQNHNIESKDDVAVVRQFYNNLFSPSYTGQKLLRELNMAEHVRIVIRYILNIYKTTYDEVDTATQIREIVSVSDRYRDIFYEIALDVSKRYNYNLNPYYDLIIDDSNYSSQYLLLLKRILTIKHNDKEYQFSGNKVEKKISDLLNLSTSNSIKEAGAFLEENLGDDRIKEILLKLIPELSRKNILSLPQKLQELSFDFVTKDEKLFDFSNNDDFLKAIGEKGTKGQIEKLIKVILVKLQKKETTLSGLDILNSVRELNKRDRQTLVGILESISEDANYKESSEAIIKRLS